MDELSRTTNNKVKNKIKSSKSSKKDIKSVKTAKKIKKIIKEDEEDNTEKNKLFYPIKPVKIIFKYNNNNRKIQYQTYIYVGTISLVFKDILEKIADLNLYDTLITLNEYEISELVRGYGNMWISRFFNVHHISYFINKYRTNEKFRNNIFKNYEYVDTFINNFEEDYVFSPEISHVKNGVMEKPQCTSMEGQWRLPEPRLLRLSFLAI